MRKKIFIILILAAGMLVAKDAGAGEQVYGYAWSDTVGWVSFRNDNANAHWDLVDDDSDATYVWTNSPSVQYDTYKLADPPYKSSGPINSVQVRVRYRGELKIGLRLNGVNNILPGVYTWHNANWRYAGYETISRPGGGQWTWSDIENLQVVVGIGKDANVTDMGSISEVYVRVNNSLVLRPNGTGDYNNIDNPVPAARYGYGVEINNLTGVISGYAWAGGGTEGGVNKPTIGWISFEPASIAGCPTAPCQASINIDTGVISGWARACSVFQAGCSGALKPQSALGGWDGWIRLKDGLYGTLLSYLVIPAEFNQWAWGGGVNIGWLSFNKGNCDPNGDGFSDGLGSCPIAGTAISDYKTIVALDRPPIASFTCSKSPCRTYQGDADLTFINTSTDPDGCTCDEVVSSEWFTKLQSEPSSSFISQFLCIDCVSNCNYTVNTSVLSPSTWHTVKLVATDKFSLWDEETMDFYILRDIYAEIGCSLDGVNLVDCMSLAPLEGDTIYVHDLTVPSESSFINDRDWSDDIGLFGTGQIIEVILAKAPSTTVNLSVIDSNNRSATAQLVIAGIMPLPTWVEIAPF